MPNTDDTSYTEYNQIFANDPNLAFMNHGYYPIDSRVQDIFLNTCATLYCNLLDKVSNPQSKTILDVSCGRGGGTNLIKNLYKFKQVSGCDYNQSNIDYCLNNFTDINFVVDDAELLSKFADSSIDCIINIEASQCFESKESFFQNANRILVSNGQMLYGDIFAPNGQRDIDLLLLKYFIIEEKRDITYNVIRSCDHLAKKTSNININRYKLLNEIYTRKGNLYKSNKMRFVTYVLRKYNG